MEARTAPSGAGNPIQLWFCLQKDVYEIAIYNFYTAQFYSYYFYLLWFLDPIIANGKISLHKTEYQQQQEEMCDC